MKNVLKNSMKIIALGLLLSVSFGVSTSAKAATSDEIVEAPDGYIKWRSRICIFGGDMCQYRPQH